MAFTAADVMRRANTILQDVGAVRWMYSELHDWLNEAMRAIVTVKPNAKTESVVLILASGTKQSLPAQYSMLSRVVRNMGVNGTTPGKAIRTLASRDILDAQIPGWHSTDTLPFSAVVDYALQDPMSPREFYVVPGNLGTGRIEAIVGVIPSPIPAPAGALALDVANYTAAVPMDDIYQGILLDLVLFRAFSKDSAAPDAAQRASAHLSLANQALHALGGAQLSVSMGNNAASAG